MMSPNDTMYYAVFIPCETGSNQINGRVLTDKVEAFRLMKISKNARFKAFLNQGDAVKFSEIGGEQFACDSPSNYERAFFKGPKSQELVKFRKAIESGNFNLVRKLIDENPRYLVSSGDTPAILQEGFRFNSLHVAARTHSAILTDYILNQVSNAWFIRRLYGVSDSLDDRRKNLLDMYLNMPDRGCHETPLHFASKFGAIEVVKVLISYPECDTTRKNKNGLTAVDIVCSRAPGNINKVQIIEAIGGKYYVPILRNDDNTLQAIVGKPFTATVTSPTQISVTPDKTTQPHEVRALAGPMSEEAAKVFRKVWKTPPRSSVESLKYRPELTDPEKGLETIGRKLARQFNVQWKEYWNFLDSFVDLSTEHGLVTLEKYLEKEYEKVFFSTKGGSWEKVINELCASFQNEAKLDAGDNTKKSPFEITRHSETNLIPNEKLEMRNYKSDLNNTNFTPHESVLSCSSSSGHGDQPDLHKSPKTSVYTIDTMEKTCQVFANRIGFALVQWQANSLISEITHFQVYLAECHLDKRFIGIDLSKSHYRLAAQVMDRIVALTSPKSVITIPCVLEVLEDLICSEKDISSKDQRLTTSNFAKSVVCICRYITTITPSHGSTPKCTAEPKVLWSAAESCLCDLPVLKTIRIRSSIARQLFTDDHIIAKLATIKPRRYSLPDADEDLVSGSDVFYTPPNSPVHMSDSPMSDKDDEQMVLSEEGPELFLTGMHPTTLDKCVLEALDTLTISTAKYPYINLWKNCCIGRSLNEPSDRWPTPNKNQRKF